MWTFMKLMFWVLVAVTVLSAVANSAERYKKPFWLETTRGVVMGPFDNYAACKVAKKSSNDVKINFGTCYASGSWADADAKSKVEDSVNSATGALNKCELIKKLTGRNKC